MLTTAGLAGFGAVLGWLGVLVPHSVLPGLAFGATAVMLLLPAPAHLLWFGASSAAAYLIGTSAGYRSKRGEDP
jgi:hypothetical protein